MKRKKLVKRVRKWMEGLGIDDLRDYDCSEAKPEDCPAPELLSVLEDIEEDEAKEENDLQLYLRSLEED